MLNFKAIRQLIMEILHLKLCDLNLTFKGHKSSKILRYERLYMTSYYVFLIHFRHNMLRLRTILLGRLQQQMYPPVALNQ